MTLILSEKMIKTSILYQQRWFIKNKKTLYDRPRSIYQYSGMAKSLDDALFAV